MYVIDDMDLQYMDWWQDAIQTASNLTEADKWEEFESMLEGMYWEQGYPTLTDINDLLWFEADWIYESLGMTDYLESED